MRRVRLMLPVFLIAASTLTSCSTNPVSPVSALDTHSGAGTLGGIQIEDPPSGIEGQGGLVGSAMFEAGKPGTITVGDFTLIIAEHSLREDARITLRQPDPDVMQVEFEVSPASANQFYQPVELVADCSDDLLSEVEDETVYWNRGNWEHASTVVLNRSQRSLHAKTHKLWTARVDHDNHAPNHREED